MQVAVPQGRPGALACVTIGLDEAKRPGVVHRIFEARGFGQDAVASQISAAGSPVEPRRSARHIAFGWTAEGRARGSARTRAPDPIHGRQWPASLAARGRPPGEERPRTGSLDEGMPGRTASRADAWVARSAA